MPLCRVYFERPINVGPRNKRGCFQHPPQHGAPNLNYNYHKQVALKTKQPFLRLLLFFVANYIFFEFYYCCRTMKTLLHTVVKSRGDEVLDHLTRYFFNNQLTCFEDSCQPLNSDAWGSFINEVALIWTFYNPLLYYYISEVFFRFMRLFWSSHVYKVIMKRRPTNH